MRVVDLSNPFAPLDGMAELLLRHSEQQLAAITPMAMETTNATTSRAMTAFFTGAAYKPPRYCVGSGDWCQAGRALTSTRTTHLTQW